MNQQMNSKIFTRDPPILNHKVRIMVWWYLGLGCGSIY